MKTLQECKDEVCLRKHNHYFIMRHRRSIDELMAITDEAAELYASQFREPSTEQSGGTEQRELKMLDPLSNNGWSFDYEAIQTISEETDNYTVDGESDMVSMEGVNSVLIALSKHYIITSKP